MDPGYGFAFKFEELDEITSLLEDEPKTKHELAKELINRPGIPKIEELIKQLRFINLIKIEKKGEITLTDSGKIYVNLKGSQKIIGKEICYYELTRNNAYFRWLFDVYLLHKRKKSPYDVNISDLQSIVSSKWNLGYKNKEHSILLDTLWEKPAFGSLRIFNKNGNRLRLRPYRPKLPTAVYVLINYIREKSLPNLPTRNFQDSGFLGAIFMITFNQIMELIVEMEKLSILKHEKYGGLDQYAINPEFTGRPLKFLRE